MFTTFSLRNRIILGSLLPLGLLLGFSVMTYRNLQNLRDLAQEIRGDREIVLVAQRMETHLERARATVRGYIITQNDANRLQFEQERKTVAELRAQLDALDVNPEQRELLKAVDIAIEKLREHNDEEIHLIQANKVKETVELVKTGVGQLIGKELEKSFTPFQRNQRKILDDLINQQDAQLAEVINAVVIVTGAAVLLAILGAVLVGERISKRIREAVSGLGASTVQIASTVDEHERTASQQAAAVNQTTATVEELGASSRLSAEQAQSTATVAQQTLQVATEGRNLATQTIESMEDMQSKVGTVAEQIARLSDQAAQIGSISRVVSDLASETNMLALNAAVEAARAGEHGKGFAVVASEVRKLAEQSKKSAERANQLVDEIQRATNAAVMVAEDGNRTAAAAAAMSRRTVQAVEEISSAANGVSVSTQQLLLNSRQQSVALNQVTEAMKSLTAGSVQIAAGTQQTQQGVRKINQIATDLKAMV